MNTEKHYQKIAWNRAAKARSLQALETLWSWSKEAALNTDELLIEQIVNWQHKDSI